MLVEYSRDVDRRLVPFYPPVPELPRCSLCGMVPSKLYSADTCRHLFCYDCRARSTTGCAFDGAVLTSDDPDMTPAVMVSGCLVRCWNHTEGCSYVGRLLEMPAHYRTCPHFSICCQSCGEKVKVMDLVLHASNKCTENMSVTLKAPITSKGLPPNGANFLASESVDEVRVPLTKKADHVWTVGPYSKLATGIHHFRSEPFYTQTGHKIQLQGCIDGIKTVELRAAIHCLPRSGGKSPTKLPKSYMFRLLGNDQQRCGSVEVSYPVEGLPMTLKTSMPLIIARMGKTEFKQKFVSDDRFVVEFSAVP